MAIITMASGATHVVHDPGRRVAMQIMSAMQQPEAKPSANIYDCGMYGTGKSKPEVQP